ncbi:MAG: ATP-binding cassette domain-containing protein [Frankiales bacterium]|nr:MAG: ATP-binding cassette domain-containing protein [Frankiales bacterium]
MTMVDLAAALWLLVAAIGLALPVAYAGVPVLGQSAFVAIGGVGTALLGPGGLGLPLGIAVLAAVAGAGAAGHLVARGASRLAGAHLALATWALAWLVAELLAAFPGVFGGEQGLVRTAPARLVSPALGLELVLTPTAHVVLAGSICLTLLLGLRRLEAGPAGLDLTALREDPALARSLGIPVAARRRAVLTVAAAAGGLSGAGTLVLLGLVAPADVGPLLSLQLFVAVLIGGTARWWGPVVGVAVLTALPEVADVLSEAAGLAPERVRGVLTAALLLGVLAATRGWGAPAGATRGTRSPGASVAPARDGAAAAPREDRPPARRPEGTPWRPVLLRATGVVHSYGAVRALAGVDLLLRGGEVHALVGPNGSGKTTLLEVLAGELTPRAGVVEVAGHPAPSGPEQRVLAGVARTPQRTVVPAGSTPRRQVAIGARGGMPGPGAVLRHLLATPGSRSATAVRERVVAGALDRSGLADRADDDPRALPVGAQRLLQVARVTATGAQVLLLDEPAAGMTRPEREHLATVVRDLAGNGHAVLLVEHDMRLVSAVADRVTVLDRGQVLATGTPEQVRADPAVRSAYLGPAAR